MARTEVAVAETNSAGLFDEGYTVASGSVGSSNGYVFLNDGRTILLVTNATGNAITVSQVVTRQIDGTTPSPVDRSIPSVANRVVTLGPFDPDDYNDTNGYMAVDFSDDGLTVWPICVVPRT